ncbi:Hypothetical predicted protein [Mytilus galloprovincialis]|uniref:Mab-21-like HhH/H2TH-like domain-containing protein n=1 Tax=Mytilus galloprovincialis TaxID=29158 RepID=A0A8B6GA75_MYTGA|nr:Hypothetical predicted protein [Mytilus galloprovincialis]
MKYLISNKLYKETKLVHARFKIHGPCLSDDNYDLASCLKCEKWVSQAVPWINRPRSSWLSPESVHKIIMRGVLFETIGFKDSINEDLEWRISFSVAEKLLIFVFNHTQLLCYALLKIFLKEILEKDKSLKGLLCSYYIKTLMFWISDDANPTVWRPDNIIPCFMACLQRLLYSVEYSTLLHYFIPSLNLFGLRLSTKVKQKYTMTVLLANLYDQGIQCFSVSETLCDYTRFSTTFNKQLNINSRLVHEVLRCIHMIRFSVRFSIRLDTVAQANSSNAPPPDFGSAKGCIAFTSTCRPINAICKSASSYHL